MVLATMFVSLPFVAREVLPVLEEIGPEQEEAAKTLGASEWQTFWRVTLPSIRWGLLYGVLLTNARAMGEFGAVAVVSGNITGKTQTLPLFVEEAYKQYHTEAAYSAAVLLACLAVVTMVAKALLENKTGIKTGAGH
jgi:sulfate transport system permease protein